MIQTPPKNKKNRWMKIVLVVSLALNLLVIGSITSRVYFLYNHSSGIRPDNWLARSAVLHITARRLLHKLPNQRRNELKQVLVSQRHAMRPLFVNLSQTRTKLAQQIAAKPFDQAKYDSVMRQVIAAEEVVRVQRTKLLHGFIKGLKPQERQQYSNLLLNPKKSHWFRKRR